MKGKLAKAKELLIVLFITLLPLMLLEKNKQKQNEVEELPQEITVNNIVYQYDRYGIPMDSLKVVRRRIKYRQNLAGILSKFNKNGNENKEIVRKIRKVFNIKKLKARNYYYAYLSSDSIGELKYFIYDHAINEFLKISLVDSIHVERVFLKTDTIQKSSTAIIKSSLWETMKENNINPSLALELSEIYAWSIDFFGLHKGDKFSIIYDELFVDSTSVGIGKIYASSFMHQGKQFFAYRFKQDGRFDFYDEEGGSLRKTFLKAPLKFKRISSRFSYSRFHPILKIRRPHRGVDYAAPTGTPIQTIGDGVVVKKGYTKGAGYYIKVKHNSVYVSGYNHLSKYAKGMRVGKHVKQGQTIGYVGSTGYATGPHLDFRIWKSGKLADPLKIKADPVKPIKEDNMENYLRIKNIMNSLLNAI